MGEPPRPATAGTQAALVSAPSSASPQPQPPAQFAVPVAALSTAVASPPLQPTVAQELDVEDEPSSSDEARGPPLAAPLRQALACLSIAETEAPGARTSQSIATAQPPAAFNLDEFARAYSPGPQAAEAHPRTPSLSLAAKVDQLFDMFSELRRELQSRVDDGHVPRALSLPAPVSSSAPSGLPLDDRLDSARPAPRTSWTLPPLGNATDLPPDAIGELRVRKLPRTRVKGEYYPPLAHQLAAHRLFRDLNSDTGKWMSPMSFVLHLRDLDCVRFDATPAVLMAMYSGRFGSRGLTLIHFRPHSELEQLEKGITNVNFSANFGANATLPTTEIRCPTYEGLLAAIGGLISVGDALWYDHARRLLSRVKRFVLADVERDSSNTPERVTLTLMYVNLFIDRALAHLLVDSPHWWCNFCEAVRAVDYLSADWQAALNGLALRMATIPAPNGGGSQTDPPSRQTVGQPRRGPSTRNPIMPENFRQLIPRDRDNREPCLRYFAGGMCYGSSPERCAHQRRTHRWEGRLPRDLQDYIDRNYGPERRQPNRRDRF